MTGRVLDGRAIAALHRQDLAERVARLRRDGQAPGLAIVRFSDAGPEVSYAKSLGRAAAAIDVTPIDVRLADQVSLAETSARMASLNADRTVAGIVVIYPVPAHLNRDAVDRLVDPAKDVDGISPISAERVERGESAYVPATALAVLEILNRYEIPIVNRPVVVVGRSRVVGQPTAVLLAKAGAWVSVAHRGTADLIRATRPAEILVVAAGVPGLIGPDHVQPGAVVIDCGITVTRDGVVGDVDFDRVLPVAGAITPVPGGVGPVTTTMLLNQVVTAAERAALSAPTAR